MTSTHTPKRAESVLKVNERRTPDIPYSPNLNGAVDEEMKKLCARTRLSIKA